MGSFAETLRHGRGSQAGENNRFLMEHGWSRTPRLVQWMVTGQCPLHCPHCLVAATKSAQPGLSLKEGAALVEQIAELGVEELLLTGGEPLAKPDLPEIIALLAAQQLRWSLNTALMPTAPQRAAMEAWPPVFVAVSLDGPPAFHDRFRGATGAFAQAMSSLQFFAGLIPGSVAAGTTVTTANFKHLPETFGLVLESGADSWGLHLLVPEGRAAHEPGLLLSRRQLKQLLAFAAAKRNYFPVTMADEIGYCGYWEPLVRDEPFFCGAGKMQCVVLPDGEVVPCTTADISTSAGNVRTRRLRDIWETGFAELRTWHPSARCGACGYASACQGGCWLQRRHGTECYREVWHMPQALTRAGAVVCLGLAATANPAEPPGMPGMNAPRPEALASQDTRQMEILQQAIIQWYAAATGGGRGSSRENVDASLRTSLPDDPGVQFFLRYSNGKTSKELAPLADEIEAALKTQQRSLCLISLTWRALTEACLDGPAPERRTAAERAALRRAQTQLVTTTDAWRKQILEQKLDPFLREPTAYRRFFLSKAGPSPWERLAQNLAGKRGWTDQSVTNSFLAAHPYAASMTLKLIGPTDLAVLRGGERQPVDGNIGVFDLVLVPAGTTPVPVTVGNAALMLKVNVPPGVELTYGDWLCLAYEQNKGELDQQAMRYISSGWRAPVPLTLPALRDRLQSSPSLLPDTINAPDRRTIQWLLTDLYLF